MEPSKLLIGLQLVAITGGGFYLVGQFNSDFEASKRYNVRQFELQKLTLNKQSVRIEKNQLANKIEIAHLNALLKKVEIDLILVKKDIDDMDNVFRKL
ncbi:hypothetical protein [Shewanella sp. YLB-07]|uniref:hypothetical protein n=1 Tax=Shewanella sp. YLB-07 TaxID=2601268 RepID=UPI00128BE393|nr:hypothetical protein [Shewanella sp. YLB-07]MPY24364.1 hypothetical protein [Shewanella sp. YLB-07]